MPNYGLGDNLVFAFRVNLLNLILVLPILINVPGDASRATEMDDQAFGKTQRRTSAYDHKLNILPSVCGGRDGTSLKGGGYLPRGRQKKAYQLESLAA